MSPQNRTREDILSATDDTRIGSVDEIIPPVELIGIPPDEKITRFVESSRKTISDIIHMKDPRILASTGPCSIHDPDGAIAYAEKLVKAKELYPHLFLVMRTYFEKPRTTVGWKGLINDPDLDDSCNIEKGLGVARELLLEINAMGIPTAVEFLDNLTPQYFGDLVSLGAIGARTTESPEHRKLASGLSMPIGFKNGTSGDVNIAIDAIKTAEGRHAFLSVSKEGRLAIIRTTGNDDTHIILRGGKGKPNYDASHVRDAVERLIGAGIGKGLIIDCSHDNSRKDYANQPGVCNDVARQISEGNKRIVGVMIEGNLYAGKQPLGTDLKYGVSITDGCVDWETNERMLRELNDAAKARAELSGEKELL